MKLGERLGGHLVLGHVDGVGSVKLIEKKESSWLFTILIPRNFRRYVVPVGSIAIDGVSLTVARLHDDEVTVSIIPHTLDHTTFQFFKTGERVNVEFDVVGKHIEQIMMHSPENLKYALSVEKLKEWGYGS